MPYKETHIELPRRELKDPDGIHERYCPQCGKIFVVQSPADWCYRRGFRLFCSWRCYREEQRGVRAHPGRQAAEAIVEKKIERQHNQHYDPSTAIAQTKEIIKRKVRGMNNAEIAEEMGLSPSVVAQRLTKWGRQLGWQPMTKKEAGIAGVKARQKKDLSAAAGASPLSGETGKKRKKKEGSGDDGPGDGDRHCSV